MRDNLHDRNIFFEIARDVRSMLHSDHCEVWRLDRLKGQLQIVAFDSDEEVDEEYSKGVTIDMNSHPIIDKFLRNRQAILLQNVLAPEARKVYHHQEEARAHGWTSLFSVPLIRHEHVIGMINSYARARIDFQDSEHEQFTKAMLLDYANRAGDAIRNAELSNQLEALDEVNQILLDAYEEENVIRQILSRGLELVGADIGALYLFDVKKEKLIFKDGLGIPEELIEREVELGEGIVGDVAGKGGSLIVPDVTKNQLYRPAPGLNVKSVIAVPLRRSQETIGALMAHSRYVDAFTKDDLYVLSRLATQIAITIERTKLTNHLNRVTHLALTRDYKELADYMVEAVRDLTGAEVNLWMMSDREAEQDERLRIVASSGDFDENYIKNETIPLLEDQAITAVALKQKKPIVRDDILNEDQAPRFYNIQEARRRGWRSFMAVPLIGRGSERLGSLSLYSREKAKFGEPDVKVMRTFANQVAIAIQQHKRSHALQQLIEFSEDFTQKMVSEPGNLLESVVNKARRLINAHCAVIYPYNHVKGEFYRWEDIASSGLRAPQKVRYKPHASGLSKLVREAGEIVVHNSDEGDIVIDLETIEKPGITTEHVVQMINRMALIQRESIKAFVGLSLRAGERGDSGEIETQEVGLLYINFRTPHHFTPDELQIIRIYAHQVANIIHGARLYRKAHRQASELEAAHETALKIVKEENVDSLLNAIVEEATKLLRGSGGKLYRRVPDQDRVELVACKGIDPKILKPGDTLAFDEGVVGIVMRTKEPMIVNEYRKWPHQIERLAGVLTAVIEVPLMLGEEAIGVLAVLDSTHKRKFLDDDIPVLKRLAQQAALAIHNADILVRERHLRKQAETLREVSSAIINSELELQEVAGCILDELGKVVEYHKASMQLIRKDARELLAYRGFSKEHIDGWLLRPISKDQLISRILVDKKPCILSRTSEAAEWDVRPPTANVQSWVGLPLVYKGEVIGLLTLDHNQPGFYSTAMEDLLIQFANQAAIAIANAIYFSDAERRIRDLEIVNNIVQTINTKLDTRDLLQTIVAQIAEKLRCTHCTIFLLQKEDDQILLVPQVTHPQRSTSVLTRRFKPGEGLAGLVFQRGMTLVLKDARTHPQFAVAREVMDKARSMLVAPVKVGDQTIGVISADQDERGWFSENDGRLLDALALHAGIAIGRAMGLKLLQEIGTRIITLEEEEKILQRIVSGAIELTNTSAGVIHLISADKSIIKSYPHPPSFAPVMPRIHNKESITRRAIESRRMITIPDTLLDSNINQELHNLARALVVTPLMIEQRVIGVLSLYDDDPHYFTETEVSLLTTLASQAAIALENARLIQRIQQQRGVQIEAMKEISRAITTPLRQRLVLKGILRWAINLIGRANLGEIRLLDKSTNELVVEAWHGKRIKREYRRIPVGKGITGWVAEHKQSQLVPNVKENGHYLPILDGTGSEIAVPMLKNNELIGVLNIEHPRVNAFTKDDLALAETIAGLAVVAVENARLLKAWQEAQERVTAAQRSIIMSEVAHNVNNLFWTIPVRVKVAKEHLNPSHPRDARVIRELDAIDNLTKPLLRTARRIKPLTKAETPEEVAVPELLELVHKNILASQPDIERRIKMKTLFHNNLSPIFVEKNVLLDALASILQNAVESIPGDGTINISARMSQLRAKPCIEINIKDTGMGISTENLKKIFDPFFTTKDNGLGCGLWMAKTFIRRLGGAIDVRSSRRAGSTFTVKIPLRSEAL
jgi:GAF domain-containing protein